MKPLFLRQINIGWDNLLRGKAGQRMKDTIVQTWRVLENRKQKDKNIKRRLEHGITLNPYAHEKEYTKHQK